MSDKVTTQTWAFRSQNVSDIWSDFEKIMHAKFSEKYNFTTNEIIFLTLPIVALRQNLLKETTSGKNEKKNGSKEMIFSNSLF